eukprot:3692318-Rhodomonas_salina.4
MNGRYSKRSPSSSWATTSLTTPQPARTPSRGVSWSSSTGGHRQRDDDDMAPAVLFDGVGYAKTVPNTPHIWTPLEPWKPASRTFDPGLTPSGRSRGHEPTSDDEDDEDELQRTRAALKAALQDLADVNRRNEVNVAVMRRLSERVAPPLSCSAFALRFAELNSVPRCQVVQQRSQQEDESMTGKPPALPALKFGKPVPDPAFGRPRADAASPQEAVQDPGHSPRVFFSTHANQTLTQRCMTTPDLHLPSAVQLSLLGVRTPATAAERLAEAMCGGGRTGSGHRPLAPHPQSVAVNGRELQPNEGAPGL